MQANEVADFLSRLSETSTPVEVGSPVIVDHVVASGLAREVKDAALEKETLEGLQRQLREATSEKARTALRAQVLEASEAMALASGGARVRIPDLEGSAYRGGASSTRERRIALTQRGRAFVDDHAPRAERAAGLSAAEFEAQMSALRSVLGARGKRAATLAAALGKGAADASDPAWRSAAIGLSSCRDPDDVIVATFRRVLDRIGSRMAPWTRAQAISAAECLCLISPQLTSTHVEGAVPDLLDRRDELLRGPCANAPEHALDAAVFLAGTPVNERANVLHAATELVRDAAKISVRLPLPAALVCAKAGADADNRLAAELAEHASRLGDGATVDTAAEALALGLASGLELDEAIERIGAYRAQLARFGATSLPAAALLTWIDAPRAETIDGLRLCGAIARTHRLAVEPGETAGAAVKLLLVTAMLATGSEGDAEEALTLGARPRARIAQLGMGTLASSVPLLVAVTAAFIQPLLDAAALWDGYQRQSQGYVHHGHYYG